MIKTIKIAWQLLSINERRKLLSILFFSLIITLIEMIGVSGILPFISIALDPENSMSNLYLQSVLQFADCNLQQFLQIIGILLCAFYILRSILNILYTRVVSTFVNSIYRDLSTKLFSGVLDGSIDMHSGKNSASIVRLIVSETSYFSNLLTAVVVTISECLIFISLYAILVVMQPITTLVLTVIFFLFSISVGKRSIKELSKRGKERSMYCEQQYRAINEALGNFKISKLLNANSFFIEKFNTAASKYAQTTISVETTKVVPKNLLEGTIFSIIIISILYITQTSTLASLLPTIAIFTTALYRMLPSMNKIVNNLQIISYCKTSLDQISKESLAPKENLADKDIDFAKQLSIKDITYEYPNALRPTLLGASLEIIKNSKIAIIGGSGCGKSTLVDLISGLLIPSAGNIYIDDTELTQDHLSPWRRKIGYIPQHIYLFDGTIADNIILNRPFNERKVVQALKRANVYNSVMMIGGIHASVGENGAMLSGGQKQRIAIARAIYDSPHVLILDEATSALDETTEQELFDQILSISKDMTLICITHRDYILKFCDSIYTIENERIVIVPQLNKRTNASSC